MTAPDGHPRALVEQDLRDDPPPFAWLDDPSRMAGSIPPGMTTFCGAGLAAVGLFGVALGLIAGGADRVEVARIATGAPITVIGLVIAHMGRARRAWRLRHPGVDPLGVAEAVGANVGSAVGNGSLTARVGRWVLVLVCAFLVFVCTLSVVNVATGRYPGSIGAMVAVVLIGIFAAVLGVVTVRHARKVRQPRD